MKTPLRTLRTYIQDHTRNQTEFTTRQLACRDHILNDSQIAFANFGVHGVTFTSLAAALRIAAATLRFHFADLDELLCAILQRHLQALVAAIAEIPNDRPDRDQLRRDAYYNASRSLSGGLNAAHILLVRDRHTLPPEELTHIETLRHSIGEMIAGDRAQIALMLLDSPHLDLNEAETMLASLAAGQPRPAVKPRPAPPDRLTLATPLEQPTEPGRRPNVAFVVPPEFFAPETRREHPPPMQ